MLSVTGPGPLWTSLAPARGNPRYKPSPRLFAHFARAVATRYRDRVDRYLIWNEPNVAGWLEPQQTCVARRVCFPASPHIYRGLVRAARPAIERADPGAQVLLGELAPRGHRAISTRSPVSPLPFLRELACVDRRYKRMRRGQCRGFRPARAGRLRLPPARGRVRARGPQPRPRPGADRRPPAAVLGARPAHADGPHRGAARPLRRLPDRVRLPDVAARPRRRDLALAPRALPPAGGVPGVAAAAGPQHHAVPVARRAGHRPRPRREGVLGLAGGPALRQRPPEAGDAGVHRAVRGRPRPARPGGALLGPDPAGDRRAHGDRAAAAPGAERVPPRRDGAHRRARLLDAPAARPAAREVPLLVGGGGRHRGRVADTPAVRRRRPRHRPRAPLARVAHDPRQGRPG